MKVIHGGDIYRNSVQMDFSVNMNPLGVPKTVQDALHQSVDVVDTYPDIHATKLRQVLSAKLGVQEEEILFGNGASELFLAIVHGIKPKKIVIPIPSFYGYFHAAEAVDADVICCGQTKEELWETLMKEVDMLFLANPNNPTGKTRTEDEMREILTYCKEREIVVVLDECFVEFCEETLSMLEELDRYSNLILVRAFTKFYSIPGVRLGYFLCSHRNLRQKIQRQLPEWNLSVFAQKAGIACVKEQKFVEETAKFVKQEREYLMEGLEKLGIRTFPSQANFLMFYSEYPWYDWLLEHEILIRDCQNFKGLEPGYYRIAVKCREENERLLQVMGEILWKEKSSNS